MRVLSAMKEISRYSQVAKELPWQSLWISQYCRHIFLLKQMKSSSDIWRSSVSRCSRLWQGQIYGRVQMGLTEGDRWIGQNSSNCGTFHKLLCGRSRLSWEYLMDDITAPRGRCNKWAISSNNHGWWHLVKSLSCNWFWVAGCDECSD